MQDTKRWWESRTIWASLLGLIFVALSALHVLPEGLSQEGVLEAVMGVVGVLAIIFRVKADSTIGS